MNPYISIPLALLIIARSLSRHSLTPAGLLFATLTAAIHSLHPSPLPFTLLGTFFLAGTTATKVNHLKKSTLTLSSAGTSGGEGPRTLVQVLANSGVATALVLLHVWRNGVHFSSNSTPDTSSQCVGFGTDILLAGIVANYAAVTADTLSSELGILARSQPRLITTLKTVPRGTNGGVTIEGLLAGALGAGIIAAASVVVGKFCPWTSQGWLQVHRETWTILEKSTWVGAVVVLGALGSVLDSLLGAMLQASVVDRRTGKVIEGSGGVKVLVSPKKRRDSGLVQRKATVDQIQGRKKEVHEESRLINSGRDLLDNNQINVLMAGIMSVCGMGVASALWGAPVSSIWR